MPRVFVVLAAYNGAPYLNPLLESIRQQGHADWVLLARDDGSSDATPEILRQAAGEDGRMRVIEDGRHRLGAAENFGILMQRAYDEGAQYLCFADQDDVWHPDKLRDQLRQLRADETSAGGRHPHLVYSDLIVVDERMRVVHPSFFASSRLVHGGDRPLHTLLGRSFILGCASMINRPLMEFALPVPGCVPSHDWWVALCTAALGQISRLDHPTLWYRRHGGNTSGPATFWAGFNPLRYSWKRRWQVGLKSFRQSVAQARALRGRIEERAAPVTGEVRQSLDAFCDLFDRPGGLRRIGRLRRLGIPAIDLPRRLLYYLCVLAGGSRADIEGEKPGRREAA